MLRAALPHARWGVKPLCVGLAGVFAFDVFFYSEAMLFGLLDPNIFVARGIATAMVIPLIAIATARNTGWTVELAHVARVSYSTPRPCWVSGVFLIAVAVGGYFVRYFGGGWGEALQIELLFAALLFGMMVASSGSFRSKLRVFISKHFFSYRYDYRQEWLRFTRTLSAESSVQKVQERCIEAIANLVESPAGALWLPSRDGEIQGPRRGGTCRRSMPRQWSPADGLLVGFLERTAWIINLREFESDRRDIQTCRCPHGWPRSRARGS
jgi:putative PEP-CTERM system histidine kinase